MWHVGYRASRKVRIMMRDKHEIFFAAFLDGFLVFWSVVMSGGG